MREFKTLKEKERHLNELYFDAMTEEHALDCFLYLAHRDRGKRTTERWIREAYHQRGLGSLLRRLDPVAFKLA